MVEAVVRIGGNDLAALMERIAPQIEAMPAARREQFLQRFEAMKGFGVDMVRTEWRDGALMLLPSEDFMQHLKAYGVDV